MSERTIWTVAKTLAFYRTNGHLPFAISGGSGEGDEGDSDGGENEGDGDEGNVEGLKSALQRERDARKQLDRDLKTVRKELTTLKGSGQSEKDKLADLQRERDDLQKSVRERDAKDAAHDIAGKLGADAKNAGVIWRAVKSDIEFDDDGTPKNLKQLVTDLKETTPHLFRKTAGSADAGSGNGGKPDTGKDWMRGAFRRTG